tara:strand:- start:293 stop:892 length:600 start_codon:yes stop_codon:yes gene_type:complete
MVLGLGSGMHNGSTVEDRGWLKCSYSATQTGTGSSIYSGIKYSNLGQGEYTKAANDYYTIQYDVYLGNNSNHLSNVGWGTDPVTIFQLFGGYGTNTSENVSVITVTTTPLMTSNNISGSNYQDDLIIRFQTGGDIPQAGAAFWLKNIVFKVYASDDTLKFTYNSNFNNNTDGWGIYNSTTLEGTLTLEANAYNPKLNIQ